MRKTKTGYCITAINSKHWQSTNNLSFSPTSNFGFYLDFDLAEKDVLKNGGYIHESYYDYVVIESLYVNVPFTYSYSLEKNSRKWYAWNKKQNSFAECQEPSWATGIVHWYS